MALPSKRGYAGTTWLDPFHKFLRRRRKLGLRYFEELTLPVFQGRDDCLQPVKVDLKKPSGIDAATRLLNNTDAPPSSMMDPSLLMPDPDSILAHDYFDLDEHISPATLHQTFEFDEENTIHSEYRKYLSTWNYFPELSFSEGLDLLDSLDNSDFALGSAYQPSEPQLPVDNSQSMVLVAPENGLLSPSHVVNDGVVNDGVAKDGVAKDCVIEISVKQKDPTTQRGLTPPPTPVPGGVSNFLQVLDAYIATDAAPKAATTAADSSDKFLKGSLVTTTTASKENRT